MQVVRPAKAEEVELDAGKSQPAVGYGLWGEQSAAEGENYLRQLALSHFPEGTQSRVIVHEDPAQGILAFAKSNGVDMIAMATHGRGGLARMVMGSVAERLVRSGVVSNFYLHRPSKLKMENPLE